MLGHIIVFSGSSYVLSCLVTYLSDIFLVQVLIYNKTMCMIIFLSYCEFFICPFLLYGNKAVKTFTIFGQTWQFQHDIADWIQSYNFVIPPRCHLQFRHKHIFCFERYTFSALPLVITSHTYFLLWKIRGNNNNKKNYEFTQWLYVKNYEVKCQRIFIFGRLRNPETNRAEFFSLWKLKSPVYLCALGAQNALILYGMMGSYTNL